MGAADADASIQPKATRKRLRSPVDRQREDFLKRCRTRLDPAELGLPQPRRKRTEGLRREDVAALSGVSVSWYTWLEQGRDMRVSDDVLERLCHTLRLRKTSASTSSLSCNIGYPERPVTHHRKLQRRSCA